MSPLFFVAHYVPTPELPAAIGNRRSRDVSEARARIEAALGTLALFEIVGDPAGDAGGDKKGIS